MDAESLGRPLLLSRRNVDHEAADARYVFGALQQLHAFRQTALDFPLGSDVMAQHVNAMPIPREQQQGSGQCTRQAGNERSQK
jgi:hypothetical protein